MTNELESTYKTLNELLDVISEPGYMFFGHYMSTDSKENIESIFSNGLKMNEKLYFLDMPTPENKAKYDRRNLPEPTIENVEHDFSHFANQNVKEIVILRLPIEYINFTGDRNHADERYIPFTTLKREGNGDIVCYVDPKYIFGSYEIGKKAVKLNENYEHDLTDKTVKELKRGYKKALTITRKRTNK